MLNVQVAPVCVASPLPALYAASANAINNKSGYAGVKSAEGQATFDAI